MESFVKNGIGFLRRLHSACWRKYLQTGIYMECKRALKVNKLRNSDIDNFILPPAYGKRMPERVIELLMAMLPYNPGKRVLDIGHANAMSCHLKMISSLPKPRNITGIDIAPPYYNHSKYYNKSLLADILSCGLENGSFDLIWCISALEHFGMDNSGYAQAYDLDRDMGIKALRRMMLILADGGTLLLTVPFGQFEDWGWMLNYDMHHWQELLSVAHPFADIQEYYFQYVKEKGWICVDSNKLIEIGYNSTNNYGASAIAAAYISKH